MVGFVIPILQMKKWRHLVAQLVNCLSAMQETRVQSLGLEDPLEKELATHSSILAWKIPWTEKPDGLQSMESQRVRYTKQLTHTYLHVRTSLVAQTINNLAAM